jgi:hypothetical protein
MFRRCLSGRAAPRRAFVNAALLALGIAAAVLVMPAAAADAAVPVPLVSTATSDSGGAAVTDGTTLTVTFSQPPVLASSYSLTLTDGSDVGTVSTAAGSLTAVVTGSSILFTVHGAPSMSVGSSLLLSVPLEILESTGVSDGSGDGWNLVASGQVDKSFALAAGDEVVVNYDEPVNVNSPYSLTLTEGSGSASINQANSSIVSGQGTSTITYGVTGTPTGSVATDGPSVTGFTGVTPVTLVPATVATGDTLAVTLPGTLTAGSSYDLTLADGAADLGTLSGSTFNTSTSGGSTTVTYTVTSNPSMTTGTQLSTTGLQATVDTAAEGFTPTAQLPFNLTAAGPTPPSPNVVSTSVIVSSTMCSSSNVGVTRVFSGSNCDIGFGNAGPTAPDVYDVIPVPTQDLPGPPTVDTAPEAITGCQQGSSDVVYDVNTEAELGAKPCGLATNPPEQTVCTPTLPPTCNTNSDTLNYIPTPGLASFEEVGVVETIPGSSYVSATAVPPQISAIAVSGAQATFTYYDNVVCETDSTDPKESSQFTYVTPYTDLDPNHLVYPTAISCPPPSGGASSVTVTWPSAMPSGTNLRFKYEGYGSGHSIVAVGSSSAGEREASQSVYVGPAATIDSFTPQSTTLPTSSGGPVNVTLSTTGAAAQACTLSAVSQPAGAATLSWNPPASCNSGTTITIPANTDYTTNVVYTVTLTAGVGGTPPPANPNANDSITITVPAAPLPLPVEVSAPTIAGAAALGQTLTEGHGSWASNPTSYSYQWEDCDGAGHNCSAIAGATAQTYVPTTADDGHALSVQETASNASGSTAAFAGATTTIPNPSSTAPAPPPAPAPEPAPAPVNVSPPAVSGILAVGRTLTESHGSWSNAPTGYAYVWERCDENGNHCVAIAGASGKTHTLTTADVAHRLRVQETASNVSGTGDAATSSPTAPVLAARTSSKHHAAPNTLLLEHQVSSHDHRATFRFKATGTASRFECALVRKPTRRGARTLPPNYVSCGSPKTFTHLEAGSYVLYVRAVGPGGADKTPASYEFRIT